MKWRRVPVADRAFEARVPRGLAWCTGGRSRGFLPSLPFGSCTDVLTGKQPRSTKGESNFYSLTVVPWHQVATSSVSRCSHDDFGFFSVMCGSRPAMLAMSISACSGKGPIFPRIRSDISGCVFPKSRAALVLVLPRTLAQFCSVSSNPARAHARRLLRRVLDRIPHAIELLCLAHRRSFINQVFTAPSLASAENCRAHSSRSGKDTAFRHRYPAPSCRGKVLAPEKKKLRQEPGYK